MNNRMLGTIAICCAPAMLAEIIIDPQAKQPVAVGVASMIFMLGSFASHIGLWRIAATGTRWYGRAPLAIQLFLITMAFLFGFFEATGLLAEDNPFLLATDASWPLSMLWMNIVGIATLLARRLPMPQRLAPSLCGTALPITILASVVGNVAVNEQVSSYIFFALLTVFWALLGVVVMHSEQETHVMTQPTLA